MIEKRLRTIAQIARDSNLPEVGDELERIANALDAYASPTQERTIQLREPQPPPNNCVLCNSPLYRSDGKLKCLNSGCEHFQRPIG